MKYGSGKFRCGAASTIAKVAKLYEQLHPLELIEHERLLLNELPAPYDLAGHRGLAAKSL